MSIDEPKKPETEVADPVGYFIEDLEYHGKSTRTQDAYNRVLRDFEQFIDESRGTTLKMASQRDCMAWVHQLREAHEDSTIASYASYLNRFYTYMTQIGVFTENPMTLVIEEMDERINTDPSRREISIEQMQSFVRGVRHPLHRAVIVMFLKTGMRVGELCNLDMRDLNVEDAELAERYDVPVRGQLDTRPDSVFVPSEVTRGASYNGEVRAASNKRKRDTVIPVDNELKEMLKGWMAIRPRVESSADPLFVSTRDNWGERLTPGMVRSMIEGYARDSGWYEVGGDASENVTPHYFRHFFTTHMRDRTGERGVVKYIRGDVASDIIDTYTHNWGDRVREVYQENIYSVGVYR